MSDNEDLFGDSSDGGDTDELIASSKAAPKPVATKKKTAKRLQKKASLSEIDDVPKRKIISAENTTIETFRCACISF